MADKFQKIFQLLTIVLAAVFFTSWVLAMANIHSKVKERVMIAAAIGLACSLVLLIIPNFFNNNIIMKYIFLLTFLSIAIACQSQEPNEWVQIRKASVNGCEDLWVRKGSPLEIAARPTPIHDTIYIDSFRQKIWAAAARLRRYAKIESIQVDTSYFTSLGMSYSIRSGYIDNGHFSKKRHSRRSQGIWISGDYYYINKLTWEGWDTSGKLYIKTDPIKRFSSEAQAELFFRKEVHRRLSTGLTAADQSDVINLTLDDHELRRVTLYCNSYETY